MACSRLPSQRQLLDSLIEALARTPLPVAAQPGDAAAGPAVALDAAEARRRELLLTLHVLLPSMVLPALDLLDRRLVTRVLVQERPPRRPGRVGPADEEHGAAGDEEPPEPPYAYFVRSLASTMGRHRGRGSAPAPRTYIVHLQAWNCSCAAFAIDSFAHDEGDPGPRVEASPSPLPSPRPPPRVAHEQRQSVPFGGIASDDRPGYQRDTPCCKHLLACLLVHSWGDAARACIDERIVTREELAGIVVNI